MYVVAVVMNLLCFITNTIAYRYTNNIIHIVWISISFFMLGMLYSIRG